jgi:dTDP-4-dehydrorhamnose 3,5-epimerase
VQISPLEITDVLLLVPKRFADARGFFEETWNRKSFAEAGIDTDFVQDNFSLSRPTGTIRGLHFQRAPAAQAKLVRVLKGAILDVAVDLRRGSPSFGRHVSARLTADGGEQILVPVGFAHGFCTLVPDTEVAYKVSDYYAPDCEGGIAWDDPALAIAWPLQQHEAVVSDKDRRLPRLADIGPQFAFPG